MKLFLYRALTFLAKPLARPLLAIRGARGKEHPDPARRDERLGRPSVPRPVGEVFWFDAVSVGEGNSILPIIDFVLEEYPGSHALVTTTTVTGAENMETKLRGKRAIHQFLPLDRRAYADKFLEHWRPSVGFFTDSGFWPNMLLSARARCVPLILLNGRVSDRSHARWSRNRATASLLMEPFVYALAKSDDDAKKLSGMGMKDVECVGNLKYGAPPPPVGREKLNAFAEAAGSRPSWIAAVTHPGEEEIVLRAHAAAREKFPGALLVLAPRHPNRGRDAANLAKAAGFETGLESERSVSRSDAVYVSDVLGGLGIYYAHCGLAFIGGSLLENLDGHNPMEAANLGAAVTSGPRVASFLETYDMLKRDGAVVMVNDEDDLAREVTALLSNPGRLAELRGRSLRTAKREAAVIERAKERLREKLREIMSARGE